MKGGLLCILFIALLWKIEGLKNRIMEKDATNKKAIRISLDTWYWGDDILWPKLCHPNQISLEKLTKLDSWHQSKEHRNSVHTSLHRRVRLVVKFTLDEVISGPERKMLNSSFALQHSRALIQPSVEFKLQWQTLLLRIYILRQYCTAKKRLAWRCRTRMVGSGYVIT